jgi:hypothetical protein
MMDKLKEYLAVSVHDSRANTILDALECLQRHGAVAAWTELGAILEYATDESTSAIVDAIEHILKVGQDQLLNAFCITMTDDIPMRTLVLESILTMENWEDHDAIRHICDNMLDPVDSLGDLVELVQNHPSHQVAEHLVDVSPAFINNVGKLYTPANDADDVSNYTPPSVERVHYIRNYSTIYPNSVARQMVTASKVQINTPINILLGQQKLLLASYEPEAPQQAAIELLGLYLISDQGEDITASVIKEYLDQLYSDMDFITRCGSNVDNILNGVRTYATT